MNAEISRIFKRFPKNAPQSMLSISQLKTAKSLMANFHKSKGYDSKFKSNIIMSFYNSYLIFLYH